MHPSTSGLARVTIRTPRRRLDLAIPHQVPLAELLPVLVRRAGIVGAEADDVRAAPIGGWTLRRGDGAALVGETALANQGVRDGDVLFLVPPSLTWPEPAFDDIVEEIAAYARDRGRTWDPSATRVFSLAAAGLVLLTGLGVLVTSESGTAAALAAALVTIALLGAGAVLSRALGDGVAGASAAVFALPYAATSGALLAEPQLPFGTDQLVVGASALILASVVGSVAVGRALKYFAAGVTVGLAAMLGAALRVALTPAGAASILVVMAVAGIGLAPLLAVRLGRLPLPAVTAAPDELAAERRPARPDVVTAVVRADEILAGSLLGVSLVGTGCVAILSRAPGVTAPLLGGLASAAMLLRARLFPTVAARLPLLTGGAAGIALTAWTIFTSSGPATWAGSVMRVVGALLAFVVLLVLLALASSARRRRAGSPYLGRFGDVLDMAAVVALAPVACAVLDLYSWVRGLAS